ncbi:MAG: hypothetical protein M1816_005150, partial [Peltula sp. TS41687]
MQSQQADIPDWRRPIRVQPMHPRPNSENSALSLLQIADSGVASLETHVTGLLGNVRRQMTECQNALMAEQYKYTQYQVYNQQLFRDHHNSSVEIMRLREENLRLRRENICLRQAIERSQLTNESCIKPEDMQMVKREQVDE